MPISIINPFMTSAAPEAEVTEVTTIADVAGALRGKYFLIRDASGSVSVTMDDSLAEVTSIDFSSVVLANLNTGAEGFYILAESGDGVICFWFNHEGGCTQPVVAADVYVEVVTNNVMNTSDAADALCTAASANGFTAVPTGTVAELTDEVKAARTDATNNGIVGLVITITQDGVDPPTAGLGARNLMVPFTHGAADTAIASAINTVIDADAAFSSSVLGATVTITDAATGARVDAADVDTGFTISVTTQGA